MKAVPTPRLSSDVSTMVFLFVQKVVTGPVCVGRPVDEVTLVALLEKSPPNFVPYSNHFLLLPDSVGSDVGGAQQGTWFLPPCVCTSAGGLRGCWGQSRPSLVHSFLVPGLVRLEIQSLHVASACYWVSYSMAPSRHRWEGSGMT